MEKNQYPLFKKLDIFGIPPLFTIRGRSTFQTHLGSSLTIICVFLIILYFLFFLNQMVNHKSPSIQSSNYFDEFAKEINLKKNNFSFVFSLQTHEFTNYIDETVYKIKAYQTKLTLNNGSYCSENIPIKVKKCNEYNFEIIKINLKNYL